MTWDGITERRKENPIPGKEGRRQGDIHCPDHAIIQESTKEHRVIVCGKIRAVKDDSEKDLAALKSYHDADMGELKLEIGKKADQKDLRGITKFVSFLVSIATLVIIGQAVWLRSDIKEVASNVSTMSTDIGTKLQRVNQRITEGVDERVRMDVEQTKQLDTISGEMKVVSWRLSQIEEAHKGTK